MASKVSKAWKRRKRGVVCEKDERFVERTSRTGKARRKEVENANVHFFFAWLRRRSGLRLRKSSCQHPPQILRPGTSAELYQVLALRDPHTTHVVPAAVRISVRCEERETRTARGEQETNRGGERRAFAFA